MDYKNTIIIIPAYNEELNIRNLIIKLKEKYKDIFVLVVDDSLNNLTSEEFKKTNYVNSKMIYRGKKLGRGSAVREGMEYAVKNNFSTIIEMDGDFSHDPDEIEDMYKKFKKNNLDLLIGSRYLKDSKVINWPKNRIIFSFLANTLAKILFSFSYSDYTNGYRIYNFSLINKILSKKQISTGFLYLTETLSIAIKNKFKIDEYPTTFKNRTKGTSSVNFVGIFKSFIDIINIKIKS